MYFDDCTMQDWASSNGSAQVAVKGFMAELSSPWADEKSQPFSSEGDFLGLMHNLEHTTKQTVTFWPRDRLEKKVMHFIQEARSAGMLKPGAASKLFGCTNFFQEVGKQGWGLSRIDSMSGRLR